MSHPINIEFPRPGERWKHHSDAIYVVLGYSVDVKTGNVEVCYMGAEGGWYHRPIGEFVGYTIDHQKRFTRVE